MTAEAETIEDRRELSKAAGKRKLQDGKVNPSAFEYLVRFADGKTKWREYEQLGDKKELASKFNREQEKLVSLQLNQHLARTGASPKKLPQSSTSAAMQRLNKGHAGEPAPKKAKKAEEGAAMPSNFSGVLKANESSDAEMAEATSLPAPAPVPGANLAESLALLSGQNVDPLAQSPAVPPIAPSADSADACDTPRTKARKQKSLSSDTARANFLRTYPWLRDSKLEDGEWRASCCLCKSRFRFDSATIKRHVKTTKHLKNAEKAGFTSDDVQGLMELVKAEESLTKKSASLKRKASNADLLTDHQREIREQQKNQDHLGVALYSDLDPSNSTDGFKAGRARIRRAGTADSQLDDGTVVLEENFAAALDDSVSSYPKFDLRKSNSVMATHLSAPEFLVSLEKLASSADFCIAHMERTEIAQVIITTNTIIQKANAVLSPPTEQ